MELAEDRPLLITHFMMLGSKGILPPADDSQHAHYVCDVLRKETGRKIRPVQEIRYSLKITTFVRSGRVSYIHLASASLSRTQPCELALPISGSRTWAGVSSIL